MATSEAYRTFIAIPIPEGIKDAMEAVQKELRESAPDAVRWTRRDQFHLTLKFLGNISSDRMEALDHSLRAACSAFAALRLRAEKIGFFPDMRFPRVIWVGVRDDKELLPELQAVVENSVKEFTFEKSEGRFTGHVTLGRAAALKRPQAENLSKLALAMGDQVFGEWNADHIEIIRSNLGSQGSRYSTLASIPLATPSAP